MKKKKVFYVQIKKCSVETYWYKDYVGRVFSVFKSPDYPTDYELAGADAFIERADAKIVMVDEYPEILSDVIPKA